VVSKTVGTFFLGVDRICPKRSVAAQDRHVSLCLFYRPEPMSQLGKFTLTSRAARGGCGDQMPVDINGQIAAQPT
jgi:hypothetical protein